MVSAKMIWNAFFISYLHLLGPRRARCFKQIQLTTRESAQKQSPLALVPFNNLKGKPAGVITKVIGKGEEAVFISVMRIPVTAHITCARSSRAVVVRRILGIEGSRKTFLCQSIQRATERNDQGVFFIAERRFQTGEQFGNRIHGAFGMPILAQLSCNCMTRPCMRTNNGSASLTSK